MARALTVVPVFGLIAGSPEGAQAQADLWPISGTRITSTWPRRIHFLRVTMKRTYQASKVRRARTHGFLVRMKTRGGRAVINARRAKGRKRLAV